jgi:hypothetical protein
MECPQVSLTWRRRLLGDGKPKLTGRTHFEVGLFACDLNTEQAITATAQVLLR